MMQKAQSSIEEVPYCFFGVIHQISRSHGLKKRWFESNLSKITRRFAAIKSFRFALFLIYPQSAWIDIQWKINYKVISKIKGQLYGFIWIHWHQKQVSETLISNYIPHNIVGRNILYKPEIPDSVTKPQYIRHYRDLFQGALQYTY